MGDASSAHKKRTEGSIDCDVAAPPPGLLLPKLTTVNLTAINKSQNAVKIFNKEEQVDKIFLPISNPWARNHVVTIHFPNDLGQGAEYQQLPDLQPTVFSVMI